MSCSADVRERLACTVKEKPTHDTSHSVSVRDRLAIPEEKSANYVSGPVNTRDQLPCIAKAKSAKHVWYTGNKKVGTAHEYAGDKLTDDINLA